METCRMIRRWWYRMGEGRRRRRAAKDLAAMDPRIRLCHEAALWSLKDQYDRFIIGLDPAAGEDSMAYLYQHPDGSVSHLPPQT